MRRAGKGTPTFGSYTEESALGSLDFVTFCGALISEKPRASGKSRLALPCMPNVSILKMGYCNAD